MNQDPTSNPIEPVAPETVATDAPASELGAVTPPQVMPVTMPGDPVPATPQVVAEAPDPAPIEFSWQASEFVQHHKNILWYAGVVAVVIVLSIGAYFLKSWLSVALFVVMGAAVIVYAQRPPRLLSYDLSADGLTIDGKLFPYKTFRSFSVQRDVAWHSIDLEPTQRFMPRMSVLFSDESFNAIVDHLLEHLPRVDRDPDFIERATRYLRF